MDLVQHFTGLAVSELISIFFVCRWSWDVMLAYLIRLLWKFVPV